MFGTPIARLRETALNGCAVIGLFVVFAGHEAAPTARRNTMSTATTLEPTAIRTAHIRLLVTDYDREFRFFRDDLGLKNTFGAEGENYADFDCNGVCIALFKRNLMDEDIKAPNRTSTSDSPDHAALIFGVPSVNAMAARLKAAGVALVTEPHDRKDWGIRVAHFRDPEGNLIEINQGLTS
ncbi:MAG TPA: VOC family protein [Fimbriimonadaceae bacterium]|nr:VOC family protein [Fimbriimonadaceae bacterium]